MDAPENPIPLRPRPAPLTPAEAAQLGVRFQEAARLLASAFLDKQEIIRLLVISAIAGEHMILVGPPGTAKSALIRMFAQLVDARYFEYLLTRFTEPNELFGPINLQRLREGVVEVETAGMVPEADIAFLDEVFLGSTAILNTLLGILNERVYRRGNTLVKCPMRLCVGATNRLPEDAALDAFADRFLARVFA